MREDSGSSSSRTFPESRRLCRVARETSRSRRASPAARSRADAVCYIIVAEGSACCVLGLDVRSSAYRQRYD